MNNEETLKDYHDPNGYKIRCGYYYPVYRSEYGGKVFYRIPVTRTDVDVNKVTKYKQVYFRNKAKNCNIPDGSIIKPLRIWEDFYNRKGDAYNTIFTLVIGDWEIKTNEEQIKKDAIAEYKKSIDVADLGLEDDLPF